MPGGGGTPAGTPVRVGSFRRRGERAFVVGRSAATWVPTPRRGVRRRPALLRKGAACASRRTGVVTSSSETVLT